MLKAWRRRRILSRHAIADSVWDETLATTPALAHLNRADLVRLRELCLLFLHEKRLESPAEFSLDETMQVRVAALACQPILELGLDWYAGFIAVVIHPDAFVIRDREYEDEDGVVHIGDEVLSGEAWEHGPVVLSWEDVAGSGRGEAYNVVAHEFAHKLDLLSGEANGLPPLHRGMPVSEWHAAFDSAYSRLQTQLDAGEEPWLDPYAAEDPGEFFAVCVELFFDVPQDLAAQSPAVYRQLARFFRQNPAGIPLA